MTTLPHFLRHFTFLVSLNFLTTVYAEPGDVDQGLSLYGEAIQGGVLRGHLPPNSAIYLGERAVPQTPEGYFVIGFNREEKSPIKLKWSANGDAFEVPLQIKTRKYETQHVNGVPSSTVNPSEKDVARIQNEAVAVKMARKGVSDREGFLMIFELPVDGIKTGVYGSQRIYNGVPKRPHYGIDYAAPKGTPVIAPADGVVKLSSDLFLSGGTLIMDHGYGLSSTFLHLSEMLVEPGEEVTQGQVVAKVGAGGRSTGAHLDWRMNWFDVRVDPEKILGESSPKAKP